jgi:hypothetical protein
MDEPRKLTPDEARKISGGLFPGANYLIRLRGRMVAAGFSPADPVFLLVDKAQEAMQSLRMAVHYASCESGVGREPAK